MRTAGIFLLLVLFCGISYASIPSGFDIDSVTPCCINTCTFGVKNDLTGACNPYNPPYNYCQSLMKCSEDPTEPYCIPGNCDVCGDCDGKGDCVPLSCGTSCGNVVIGGVCTGTGIGSSNCVSPSQGGSACKCDAVCQSGKCCGDGTCKGATNGCCVGSECPSGICDSATKTCTPSSTPAECKFDFECGKNSTACNSYCSGRRNVLCSYPSNPATCERTCVSGTCQDCIPSCGTANCNTDCGKTAYCPDGSQNCVPCSPELGNCNDYAVDGCEVNLQTDASNCGRCGNTCGSGQLCCSGVCKTVCSSDAQCSDGNTCTQDTCSNPGVCNSQCAHTTITACFSGDGCCPTGCKYSQDMDCPTDCGNGGCEANENYCNCPEDCDAKTSLGDVPGEICKQYVCSGTTRIEVYKENCCGNGVCETWEGCTNCPRDCSCSAGNVCKNNQCVYEKLLQNGEECVSNSQCQSYYCNNGYCCAAGVCCRKNSECLQGQVCSNYTCQTPDLSCADGTPTGQCSKGKPKYCNNGIPVDACATCGCPEGWGCTLYGMCYRLQCADETAFDNCSSNKPLFCKDGALVSKCVQCGCKEGLMCDRDSGSCYERPAIAIVSPHENETINVGEEKKVVVSGVISRGKASYGIEGNDSRFILASYEPSTGEFAFENISPISEGFNSLKITVADNYGNLLRSESRSFKVIDAPAGIGLLQKYEGVFQFALLLLFLILLLKALIPFLRRVRKGIIDFPEGSIILVEGGVGSGKEEFCLELLRREVGKGKFGVVFSYDPSKEEGWFGGWEKSKLLFVRVEPDINEIALSVSRALGSQPKEAFFNILNLLIPKYNAEELTDFLSTNFTKLRNAGCGAVFCIDKGINQEVQSAIEGLFDGIVEFQVQEEKGKLSSYFRVREFKLKKLDTDWRRFK